MAMTSRDIVKEYETAVEIRDHYIRLYELGRLAPELVTEVRHLRDEVDRLNKLHAPIGGFGGMYSGGSDV